MNRVQPNPCLNCGSTNLKIQMEQDYSSGNPNQYCQVVCQGCGRKGPPGCFFKDCGMENMTEDEICIESWNFENPEPLAQV